MTLRRRMAALVCSGCVLAVPGTAHADPAAPTDFRTEVVSIVPETQAFAVTIEGGDSFVRVVAGAGTEIVVLGYDDEPYVLIDAEGAVFENRRSPATYSNATRFGIEEIPADVDTGAAPEWEQVATGGAWAWHDHRAHWMSPQRPVGMEPGDSLPPQVIPLQVDGSLVEVTVTSTLVADPSWWPTLLGALVGIALTAVAAAVARPAVTALAMSLWSTVALTIGLAQFLSLPAETGPSLYWWLAPAVALICALGALVWRTAAVVHLGLVVLSGVQLVVWVLSRRSTFVRAVLPTDAPFWVDRAASAAVGAGASILVGTSVAALGRLVRQPASAASIAAFKSS